MSKNPLTKGRLVDEPDDPIRSPFQRDRDRILHSNAFRRLKHKTQVFIAVEGDHTRTRLTHSLEVAQIARTLTRALKMNEDLAEALALCHDLGHPPFGHAGESALDSCVKHYSNAGFDHNIQTLRILTKLENRYARHDGLNLCWETIEGTVKHNMPVPDNQYYQQLDSIYGLDLAVPPSLEAQVAALSDDIAYTSHDMDDGIRSGHLKTEQLVFLPVFGELFQKSCHDYNHADIEKQNHQAIRRIIRILVMDVYHVFNESGIISHSPAIQHALKQAKNFLYKNLYYHSDIIKQAEYGKNIIIELFNDYMNNPDKLPLKSHRPHYSNVADYIAGMTDQFAIKKYLDLEPVT